MNESGGIKRRISQRTIIMLLAAIGLVDSLYLTYVKLAQATIICADIGDCEAVNNSRYAEIGGIPIALLGAGAYLMIMLLSGFESRFPAGSLLPRGGVFGIALSGTIYSGYLTYLELMVLKAICPYCVISAILITVILAVSILRLLDADQETG